MENKIIIITCLLLFIVAIFIGYNYIYLPQIQRIEDKKNQLMEEIEKNKIAYKIYDLQQEVGKYMRHFPESLDTSWLMSRVSQKVRRSGVEFLSIKPKDIKHFEDYYIIFVNLKLKSSYHELGRFISELESSEDFLRVKSVKISRPHKTWDKSKGASILEPVDREGNVIGNVELEICTFFIP